MARPYFDRLWALVDHMATISNTLWVFLFPYTLSAHSLQKKRLRFSCWSFHLGAKIIWPAHFQQWQPCRVWFSIQSFKVVCSFVLPHLRKTTSNKLSNFNQTSTEREPVNTVSDPLKAYVIRKDKRCGRVWERSSDTDEHGERKKKLD